MHRDLLPHLPVLLAVARRGGFAAAAAELGLGASAVSHAVRLVEERLGTPVFHRTTRSVALTEAGAALVAAIGGPMAAIAEAMDHARAGQGAVTGLLRLNVPRVALPLVVTPILERTARELPGLTVEAFTDDALVDIVAAGFDAGIRVGAMIAQDMVTLRLTPPFRSVVVGAPAYLSRAGAPLTIEALRGHACINYRQIERRGIYRWELERDGADVAVEVAGPVIVNDTLHARDLARRGIGLAYLFEPLVRADLASGRLVQVLGAHAAREEGLFLYYPRRSRAAPKLRAFVEVARRVAAAAP
jgi:DNA-binding transcriptional LysR family regulator